jgi:hypothetical protein
MRNTWMGTQHQYGFKEVGSVDVGWSHVTWSLLAAEQGFSVMELVWSEPMYYMYTVFGCISFTYCSTSFFFYRWGKEKQMHHLCNA